MTLYSLLRELHRCLGLDVYLSPSVLAEYETQLYLGVVGRIPYLHMSKQNRSNMSPTDSQLPDVVKSIESHRVAGMQCADEQTELSHKERLVHIEHVESSGDAPNVATSREGTNTSLSQCQDTLEPMSCHHFVVNSKPGYDRGRVEDASNPTDHGDKSCASAGDQDCPESSNIPGEFGDTVLALPPPTEVWAVDSTPLTGDDHQKNLAAILESNAKLFAKESRRRVKEAEETDVVNPSRDEDRKVTEPIEPCAKRRREFILHQSNVRKLHVKNINYRTSQKKLWSFFSEFGPVDHCRIFVDYRKKSKGRGYVIFKDAKTAELVLKADEESLKLDKRNLLVEPFRDKKYIDATSSEDGKAAGVCKDDMTTDVTMVASLNPHSISVLNDHILYQILSFMSLKERLQCERVCKKWQQVSREVWRMTERLSLQNQVRRFGGCSDRHIRLLLKRGCPVLRSIDLTASARHLGDATLEAIGNYCPRVVEVNLSGTVITNRGLRTLAEKVPQLQIVHLRNCHDIGEKGIWWLLHKCKSLKELSFDNNHRIKGQCFHVASSSTETISLSRCLQLKDDGVEKLAARCTNLVDLDLSDCRTITNRGICVLKQFKCLKMLKLSKYLHNYQVNETGLLSLADIVSLEVLDVSFNRGVTDEFLCALGEKSENLRELDISSCSAVRDAGIAGLSGCPKIQVLKMNYLISVMGSASELARCLDLRDLELRGCCMANHQSVCDLLEFSFGLERVDLSGCQQISQCDIEHVARVMATQPDRNLTLILGGTDVVLSRCELPSNLKTVLHDYCNYSQIESEDLALYVDDSDESYGSDEFDADDPSLLEELT